MLVVIYENEFNAEWSICPNLFCYVNTEFDVQTKFPVRSVRVNRGTIKYRINQATNRVRGRVYTASLWSNLICTLIVSTFKRDRFNIKKTQKPV